jgi:hypothetical protein
MEGGNEEGNEGRLEEVANFVHVGALGGKLIRG